MSHFVESMHSRWLASSIACCFPRLPDQSEPEPLGECTATSLCILCTQAIQALGNNNDICRAQPRPIAPLTFEPEEPRTISRQSHRPSQWLADGRSFASMASSRASLATRRNVLQRTTIESIGAPYDFKKMEPPRGRGEGFRPLTLSIHVPGNELPPLPEFDEAYLDDARLTFPPPALTKSRSEPMLLRRPSTAYSIPRKPVASRAVSMDVSMDISRPSVDSRYTFNDNVRAPQSIYRRPSIASSHSTQDFLDTLDARLPQSPPLSRTKPGPEPVYTLYRKASDQSLRLRTHLEERQQIERRFPECDTIMEDREGDLDRSPIMTRQTGPALLGEEAPPAQQPPQQSEEVTYNRLRAPSTRTRISQWLLRANPTVAPPSKPEEPVPTPFYSLRPSSIGKRTSVSSSVYSTSTAADLTTTAWTTPRSSPRWKGGSLSSCQTMGPSARNYSLDVEKNPVPVVVDVGVAF